jgi:hypothetical protein
MGDWDYGTMQGDDGNTYYWYITFGTRLVIYREEDMGEDTIVFEKSYSDTSEMDIYHIAIDWVYANGGVYKPDPPIIIQDPDTGQSIVVNPDDPLYDYYKGLQEGNGGIETGGRARLLNVAGYWTMGVAQGTLFMLVPMVMIGISVGFMQRVVKLGAKVGGE